MPKKQVWQTKLKELNKEALQDYRRQLQETVQTFENDRIQAIDEVVADVNRRAELLK